MSDAKSVKDLGIPLRIDGSTRFVKGATKYTTCSDVIKMVLKKTGIQKDYRHLFSIYEVTKDGERLLPCKSRIMQEMKKWTDENNRFVLRKNDPLEQKQRITVKFEDSQKHSKKVRVITADKLIQIDSSSESSDTSFEDFLSKVDQTKFINFMKLFKAMTTSDTNKMADDQKPVPEEASYSTSQSGVKYRQRTPCRLQSRNKIKQTRRSRSSASLQDRHPNKIHRVDYGYVDRVPRFRADAPQLPPRTKYDIERKVPIRKQDSVSDMIFIRDNNKQRKVSSTKKAVRRMLPFAKYLSSGKRKVDDQPSSEDTDIYTRSTTVSPDTVFRNIVPNFRPKVNFEVLDGCREIWDDRIRQEVYSGQDDSSESSSQAASTSMDSLSSDMSVCCDAISDKNDVNSDSQSNQCSAPCTRLVDYSISSEDAYDCDDDLDDSFDESDDLNRRISSDDECRVTEETPRESSPAIKDVSSYIKNVFSKNRLFSEDDEMDSFMKSKIYDDSSDEGVSSLESGLDHVHI